MAWLLSVSITTSPKLCFVRLLCFSQNTACTAIVCAALLSSLKIALAAAHVCLARPALKSYR